MPAQKLIFLALGPIDKILMVQLYHLNQDRHSNCEAAPEMAVTKSSPNPPNKEAITAKDYI